MYWDEEMKLRVEEISGIERMDERLRVSNHTFSYILNCVVDYVEHDKKSSPFSDASVLVEIMSRTYDTKNQANRWSDLCFIDVHDPKYQVANTKELFDKMDKYAEYILIVRYFYKTYTQNYILLIQEAIAARVRVKDLEEHITGLLKEKKANNPPERVLIVIPDERNDVGECPNDLKQEVSRLKEKLAGKEALIAKMKDLLC